MKHPSSIDRANKALCTLLLIVLSLMLVAISKEAPPLLVSASLQNAVVFDGYTTSAKEWEESTPLDVNLGLDIPPQPPFLSLRVWSKHDTDWIYFLYRIAWPSRDVDPGDTAEVMYFWGRFDKEWQHSDLGTVSLVGGTEDWYGWDGTEWYQDTSAGGTNDVEGTGNYDGTYYWFEFRKALYSEDGRDWALEPGERYGLMDDTASVYGGRLFFALYDDTIGEPYLGMASIQLALLGATTTTTATSPQTTIVTTSQIATTAIVGGQIPLSIVGLGAVVGVGVLASLMVLMRRRKGIPPAAAVELRAVLKEPLLKEAPPSAQPSLSTGYGELDHLLAGGLPEGYSVVLLSPSFDERDLLLRRVVEASISSGRSAFYVSGDIGRTQELATRYSKGFYAFSPQADRATLAAGNLYKIPGIENLSELNISLTKAMETPARAVPRKIMVLDILSDVLLHHKALITRKWLTDFVARRRTEGFTILATLNPLIASKEETQTVVDLFDGIIEVYEREIRERSRRFLIVRKMHGRRYSETELMLDKDKLF